MGLSFDIVMLRRGNPADSTVPISIHGLRVWHQLAEELRARGHRFWLDVATAELGERPIVLLWDFGSVARAPRSLLARAEGRVIAWSLESPLVAHRGFHRIHAIARESAVVMTFGGARALVEGAGGTFEEICYPIEPRPIEDSVPWTERRFMVMINSNKTVTPSMNDLDWSNPKRSLRILAASLLARSNSWSGSWTPPNLYRERVRALAQLADRDDFELFGQGWTNRIPGIDDAKAEAIRRRYRGVAEDKTDVLKHYRFSLCFENTRFPGYVTEKLFDAFFSGSIPVYLGAPNIQEHVPPEAFVDVRDFPKYSDLIDEIAGMDSATAGTYQDKARRFLSSPEFETFSNENFVRTVAASLRDVMFRRS